MVQRTKKWLMYTLVLSLGTISTFFMAQKDESKLQESIKGSLLISTASADTPYQQSGYYRQSGYGDDDGDGDDGDGDDGDDGDGDDGGGGDGGGGGGK